MDDTKIKCFLYAAEYLNFTEAAAHMYITQPAFSRNIANMEQELGFPLFIRDNKQKSCRLSPEGAVMYKGICKLKAEYFQLYNKAKRVHRGEEGKISIGFLSGYRMNEKTQKVLDYFNRQYKNLEMELLSCNYNELINKLYSGELDLSITLEPEVQDKPGIIYEKLFDVDSYLVVPNRLQVDEKKIYSIKDFEKESFIFAKDAVGITSIFKEVIKASDIHPPIIEAPDFNTQMLWIEAGIGVAGNGKEHSLFKSPYVKFVKIKEFHPLNFVAAWCKDNYNPMIALFYTSYELID